MAAEWFCQIMGEEVGPISSTKLRQLVEQGTVSRDTFVKNAPDADWVPAERVKGLFLQVDFTQHEQGKPPNPPPLPTHDDNGNRRYDSRSRVNRVLIVTCVLMGVALLVTLVVALRASRTIAELKGDGLRQRARQPAPAITPDGTKPVPARSNAREPAPPREPERPRRSLCDAARSGNLVEVNAHLHWKSDVNARNEHGRTPLYYAVESGRVEVVKTLLANGAEVLLSDPSGLTPLHVAAHQHRREIVEALVKAKSDVNAKDENGDTPLHWTAVAGQAQAAEVLLAAAADPGARNNKGHLPLDMAAICGQAGVAKALLDAGVNVNAERDGWTALHCASLNGARLRLRDC